MRTTCLILPALALTSPLAAQQELADAVRAAITPDRLEVHTRAIVQHERPSGSPGENAAIDYIVSTLRAAGVPVEVYAFRAFASDPVSARVEVVGSDFAPDAITMSFSGSAQALEATLVDAGTLRDLPGLEVGTGERLILTGNRRNQGIRNGADVTGAIVLVEGQPRNVPVAVLAELGAVGIIFMNPEERLNDLIVTSTWGTPSLRNQHRLPTLPVAQIRKSAGEDLRGRLAEGPVRVRLSVVVSTGWKEQRIAVARIPGPTTDAPFVLFGGHIDGWYHGGTDEGASNAAMVELTRAFYQHRHLLRRGLVVAWWPGHSNGRYAGSTWFADHFFGELRNRGIAYVNIDGVGQMGAKRFGAATTSALAPLASRVVSDQTGATIEPTRPGRNSDQSFNGIGLPLLQINHSRLSEDGGYWWWHTPDDTFDKVDFDILKTDTDLYVGALSALLAAPMLPVDLTSEVAALGDIITQRERSAQGQFDLQGAKDRQAALLALAEEIAEKQAGAARPDLDVAVIRTLRPLYRVLYLPSDPFHPDPGMSLGMLPGLAPMIILATEDPSSDRYRFAYTTLIRERNRLIEAIDQAIAEAQLLLAALAPKTEQ
ncbi:MAG: M28 family metallopeptidase [Gemmatimonadetes bacterium]|nr:M28 family metallopeptidase [Gemmatimonadota bacterium]